MWLCFLSSGDRRVVDVRLALDCIWKVPCIFKTARENPKPFNEKPLKGIARGLIRWPLWQLAHVLGRIAYIWAEEMESAKLAPRLEAELSSRELVMHGPRDGIYKCVQRVWGAIDVLSAASELYHPRCQPAATFTFVDYLAEHSLAL